MWPEITPDLGPRKPRPQSRRQGRAHSLVRPNRNSSPNPLLINVDSRKSFSRAGSKPTTCRRRTHSGKFFH